MLRTFSDNPTCRHIVFGGCHDAGYLVNFEHFKHNTSKASRITLLETTPAYRGFAELINFKRARFDDIFKSEPLPDYIAPTDITFASPPLAPPIQHLVRSPTQPPPGFRTMSNNSSPSITAKPAVTSPSPSTTPLSFAESNGDSSWGTYMNKVLFASGVSLSSFVTFQD